MEQKLPPHPENAMQWSPREQRVLVGHFDKAIEPLQQRITELEADNKSLRDQNTQLDADLARLEAQLASGQEPVGWVNAVNFFDSQKERPTETVIKLVKKEQKAYGFVYPIYAHPAPAQQFNNVGLVSFEVAQKAFLRMQVGELNRRALLPAGMCPECDGEGEQGGQFTSGLWPCDSCNGTGKTNAK